MPVDLWVVFAQPGVSKDDILFPEFRYCKLRVFRVTVVAEDEIHDSGDGACFV